MMKYGLVFIIDDDLMQNEIHTILLQKIYPGINIKTFKGSNEAIEAIDLQELPDIIFLDLHLPGEDNSIFLDAHEKRNLSSDIYLMSALAFINDQSLSKQYSAVKEFISKPLLEHKIKHIFKQFA